jgi:hypothetical protein
MKKRSTSKDEQDIPEYSREQLGAGVRGKHHKQFMQGGNVVVLQPEVQKAYRTSEKVRQLAEQTGTPFVIRKPAAADKRGK